MGLDSIRVMTQITEAIYTHGVLRPLGELQLAEDQKVRLIVEPVEGHGSPDRQAALDRLHAGIREMNFRYGRRLPSRDELHDRT